MECLFKKAMSIQFDTQEHMFSLLLFVLLGMKLSNSLCRLACFHYRDMLVCYYFMVIWWSCFWSVASD